RGAGVEFFIVAVGDQQSLTLRAGLEAFCDPGHRVLGCLGQPAQPATDAFGHRVFSAVPVPHRSVGDAESACEPFHGDSDVFPESLEFCCCQHCSPSQREKKGGGQPRRRPPRAIRQPLVTGAWALLSAISQGPAVFQPCSASTASAAVSAWSMTSSASVGTGIVHPVILPPRA